MRVRGRVIIVLICWLLAGCGRAVGQNGSQLVVGSTPGKALATVFLSPTPPVTAQPPAAPTFTPAPTLPLPTLSILQPTLPIGTVGPLQQELGTPQPESTLAPTGQCSPVPPVPFLGPWSNPGVQQRLGCPLGLPQERTAAFQRFEHGYMFWIQAEGSIYVLSSKAIQQGQPTDNWWRLEDTWHEGDAVVDEGLFPPEGLLQPQRGFGKVWRSNGFVREALGWALDDEEGFDAAWLQFERGWMMTTPNEVPVFALVPSGEPPYNSGIHMGPQS